MEFLYTILYYSILAFGPFIFYFLIFKKKNADGSYKGANWFYPIKYYAARKELQGYIRKSKYLTEMLYANFEADINVSSVEEVNRQTFFATDQNGNNLSLSFIIGIDKIVEVRLCIRLADGNVYVLPEDGGVYVTNLAKEQWKVKGLSIEVLEPYRRMRIIFNGLLRNVAMKNREQIEHVQFHFIFNSAASPVFVPQDLDENFLISSLASGFWKDSSWKNNLVHQVGFYQFGALQGFVKGDSYPTEKVLNLATCRSRFNGKDDRQILNRSLTLLLLDKYGNLFKIVSTTLKDGCSQMNYGCGFLSTNRSVRLKYTDVRLENIGRNKSFPDHFVVHIGIKGKNFKFVIDLQKRQQAAFVNNMNHIGYECINIPAQCDVNSTTGSAVMEFYYDSEGYKIVFPKQRISELNVQNPPSTLVADIKSKDAQILQLTGGKGNSLALLASLASEEFIVPEGFIVTTNAYKLQVASNENIKRSIVILNGNYCQQIEENQEDASNRTVNLLKNEKLLPEIVNSIKTYFDKYRGKGLASWAVRSSAIGEDSDELSAAGQNETFLGCKSFEEVLDAVTACWASMFKTQSVTYRWQHGLPIVTDMAVVVQKIVPSESAGVLFTCHPTTANPAEMVVTSNFGIGETVVSGDVDPDTFILKRSWENEICISKKVKGTKTKRLEFREHSMEEISNESDDFSLTDEQLLKLAKVGVLIEDVFGNPRDIEWAFYKNQLYLLQSRPITTLYTWSNYELTHELDFPLLTDQSIFTVANIREVMPNALTVLATTTSVKVVDTSLQKYAQENYDPKSMKGVCIFQHNPFLDTVNSFHRNATEDIKTVSLILDLAIFGHPVLDEEINTITLNRLGGPMSGLSRMLQSLRVIKSVWNNVKILKRAKKLVRNLTFELDERTSAKKMLDRIDQNLDKASEVSLCHSKTTSVSVFYQVVAINILLEGGNVLTPDHYADFAVILSSCEDVISAEVPVYLEKIGKMIRDHFDGEEFCKLNASEGVQWINQNKLIKDVFNDFLSKHGHRSLNEFEVMEKSWREDQSSIIPMIQANVRYGKTSEKKHQTVEEIVKKLITPKKSSTRRAIKFLMKKMQAAVGVREQTKSEIICAIDKLRQAFRVLGKKMVNEGIIPKEDLLYHLTQYEIRQLITSRNPILVTKALRREKLYPTWSSYKYPEISFGAPKPEKSEENVLKYSAMNSVTGTPVCSGSVKARACVINNLSEIGQLHKGDILITYSTDIGWSPYFPMISGIVTELGGLVSHGAVVAREYGLPSIVGVKNVTKIFNTGDIVLLNGDKGELGKIEE